MHLASISSQEENDKLEKYVKDFGRFNNGLSIMDYAFRMLKNGYFTLLNPFGLHNTLYRFEVFSNNSKHQDILTMLRLYL
jgi:hypothetical protein